MSDPLSAKESPSPTFEEAIVRLNEIVQTLERGEIPLEDSLRLFEEGVRLSRISREKLDAAEKKIARLLSVQKDGTPVTEPFDSSGSGD
jgi:exodeoxyribonuclease VII small subunit